MVPPHSPDTGIHSSRVMKHGRCRYGKCKTGNLKSHRCQWPMVKPRAFITHTHTTRETRTDRPADYKEACEICRKREQELKMIADAIEKHEGKERCRCTGTFRAFAT